MIGVIYKYTSPSGKIYIGQTIDEHRRRNEFLNIKNRYGGYKINNARLKYGPENFKYEILECINIENYDDLILELNNKEQYYISFYNSIKYGYNNTFYGNLSVGLLEDSKQRMINSLLEYYKTNVGTFTGKQHTDETKNKISKIRKEYYKTHQSPFKGKHHTENTKLIFSVKKKEYHKNHPGTFTGKHHSIETKQKISKCNSKPILQIDKNNFEVIKEWPSAIEACKSFGVKNNDLCPVLKGKRKTWHGYIWKYKE